MTRDDINQICAQFAGATAADPTSELDSWKVGGKMFICFGTNKSGFCVKTDSPETAQMLIDAGAACKAPYFHRSWVLVAPDSNPDELRHRIAVSYDIIRANLTKKMQASLDQA